MVVGKKPYFYPDPNGSGTQLHAVEGDIVHVSVAAAKAFPHRLKDPKVAQAQMDADRAVAEAQRVVDEAEAEALTVSPPDANTDE
jgi:hypothetical protein